MKKALLLAAFSLSTALACDIQPGYVAHGLIRDTMKMQPFCALGDTMRGQITGSKWAEVWGVTNDVAGMRKISAVMSALTSKGFQLLTTRPTEKGKAFGYARGSQTVVLLTALNDPLIFLAIGGK